MAGLQTSFSHTPIMRCACCVLIEIQQNLYVMSCVMYVSEMVVESGKKCGKMTHD